MAKNLDGIKKLSPDDIKKYRKIVLNYIGEKDSAEVLEKKNSRKTTPSLRKVDGVINKISRFAAKEKAGLRKSSAASDLPPVASNLSRRSEQAGLSARPVTVLNKDEKLAQPSRAEAERLAEAIKRQEEERRKIKEEERQYLIKQEQTERDRQDQAEKQRLEKISLEKARIRQQRDKQLEIEKQKRELVQRKLRAQEELVKREELRKREIAKEAKRQAEAARQAEEVKKWAEKMKLAELEAAENKRIRENIRLEKAKRREEIIKLKQERKIKQQAIREKNRLKRQKAWRKMKKNFNFKLKALLFKVRQNIIYIISFTVLFLAIIYIIFCLAVLRFNNNLIGRAANYLPVPAALTSQGIISYNDLRKIANDSYLILRSLEKKSYLARWIILHDLKNKYKLPAESADNDLAIKYVLDKKFNQIGLSRINKINETLKGQADIEQLGKYADEYNDGAYYEARSATAKFGSAVLKLAVGQTSNIIPRIDGYYIVKRIDDKKSQLGFKYIFIKAQTLEKYVNKKLDDVKVFILAN